MINRSSRGSPCAFRARVRNGSVSPNMCSRLFAQVRLRRDRKLVFHVSKHVLFASINQLPLFPVTGPASDVVEGEGRDFTANLPVCGIRGRGLGVARRARRRAARAGVRATARAGLRGMRRASRRSARGSHRDRRGVRGDRGCCVWSVRVAGGANRRRWSTDKRSGRWDVRWRRRFRRFRRRWSRARRPSGGRSSGGETFARG